MKGLALLVLLAGAVAAGLYFFVFDHETATGTARITSVTAAFTPTTSVVVEVEVEATAAMPPVGPHVIVSARCDDQADEVIGDVGLMNNAPAGERRTDAIELLTRASFPTQPLRCQITARTSDGASRGSACLELGTARPGDC